MRKIFLYAGITLLCLGLASLAGMYWRVMPREARFAVIIASYLAAVTAYHFSGKSVLLLLSSIIVGAGVYLLSELGFANSLLVQFVYVAVAAIVMRDLWQVYLAQLIALTYFNVINAIDIFALQFMNLQKVLPVQFFTPLHAFIMLLALWVCAYRYKSAIAINIFITLLLFGSRLSLCFGGTIAVIVLALFGVALSFINFADVNISGIVISGTFALMLTWPDIWRGELFASHAYVYSISCAIISGLFMLFQIYRGHNITGAIFFVILAFRYFLDNSFSYAARSIGFILTGAVFLFFAYTRFNKR